jgi:hypothetical protein
MYPAGDPEKQAEKRAKFEGGGTLQQLACTDGRVEQMLSFLVSGNVMLERHRPLHVRYAELVMSIINRLIRQRLIPFVRERIREGRPFDESVVILNAAANILHYNMVVGLTLVSPEMHEYRAIELRDRGRDREELDAELFEFVQSLYTGFGLLLRRDLDTDANRYPIPIIMPPALDFERLLGGLDIGPEERAEVRRLLSTLDRTTEHGASGISIRRREHPDWWWSEDAAAGAPPCRHVQVVPLLPYYQYWTIRHAPGGNVRQLMPLATFLVDVMATCRVTRVYEVVRREDITEDVEVVRCIETLTPTASQSLFSKVPLSRIRAPTATLSNPRTNVEAAEGFFVTIEDGDTIMRHLHGLIPIVNFGRHRQLRNAREFVRAGGNPRKYMRAVMKALFGRF